MARLWVDLTARKRGNPPLFVSFDSGRVEWADIVRITGPSELIFEPDGHDNGRHVVLFAADDDIVIETRADAE